MRLARVNLNGIVTPALCDVGRVLPLKVGDQGSEDIKGLIARDDFSEFVTNVRARTTADDWLEEDSVRYDVPVGDPSKIVCLGLNYRDHAAEGGHPIPDYPALFLRVPTSVVGHRENLVRPRASERFDYEAELMAVIGRTCRHVREDEAHRVIFGYTVFNDGSLRDFQRKSTQWTAGKNFDASGAVGPHIVSADELPPGAAGLRITCRVNGMLLQDGNTADMIFPVARAVALVSEIMTLQPGDLVALGTPAGVGFAREPPVWLAAGDVCEVEIGGVGRLVNTVVDES